VTLKKIRSKYRFQKVGCKKRVIVIQKEKRPVCLFFFNTNDPVFCILLFATHILDPFLKVPDPKKYQVNLIN
jgi:hypothetical protein